MEVQVQYQDQEALYCWTIVAESWILTVHNVLSTFKRLLLMAGQNREF